jgi:hypothetical protein
MNASAFILRAVPGAPRVRPAALRRDLLAPGAPREPRRDLGAGPKPALGRRALERRFAGPPPIVVQERRRARVRVPSVVFACRRSASPAGPSAL